MLKKIGTVLIVVLLFCNVALADVVNIDFETGKMSGLPRHFANVEKVSSYNHIASIFGLSAYLGIFILLGMLIYKIITFVITLKRKKHTNNSKWIIVATVLVALIFCSLIVECYFDYLSDQEMQPYYNAISGNSSGVLNITTYLYQNPSLIGMISFFGIVLVILIVLLIKRTKKIKSNIDTNEEED